MKDVRHIMSIFHNDARHGVEQLVTFVAGFMKLPPLPAEMYDARSQNMTLVAAQLKGIKDAPSFLSVILSKFYPNRLVEIAMVRECSKYGV